MKTYIALLRGINVGGHNKIPMAELRDVLSKLGFIDVETYIQTGNIIYKSNESKPVLEQKIYNAIKTHFGFEISTLVKTKNELQHIFDACPFAQTKKESSYFAILSKTPKPELVTEALQKTYENEEFYILNHCIYFYCANGYGKAKFNLNYFEKKLNVNATARNYKTMVKLLELSK